MAFKVIEQGRNNNMVNARFIARVIAGVFIFYVYWNEDGLVKISSGGSDESPNEELGLKFADLFDKLKNKKSESTLKQFLVQGMDKKIYDAQYGKLKDLCRYTPGAESFYDHNFNDFYPEIKEELIFQGIYGEMELVSEFGLTLKNDTPERRKEFVRSLQFQKQNILDAVNR